MVSAVVPDDLQAANKSYDDVILTFLESHINKIIQDFLEWAAVFRIQSKMLLLSSAGLGWELLRAQPAEF